MNPLTVKEQGLYCSKGDFFIDAWSPVPRCIITHAHGDHAIAGHGQYIAVDKGLELLKYRLGSDCPVLTFSYHEKIKFNDCWVSFHPAGHILGSAQVRIETENGICVVSGDYKRAPDPTCEPFEVIKCDTFVTESTFALPIYNWEPGEITAKKIYKWWMENRAKGLCSILYCYALGKTQRVMALLGQYTQEPIYVHGAILPIAEIYEKMGIRLIPYLPISAHQSDSYAADLILAPPMAKGTAWMNRFYPFKSAFVSGWMQVRGARKQRNVDHGFVLSDHADWQELLKTIKETGASKILTTHGNASTLARYLNELGINASPLLGTELLEEGEG